MDGYWVSKNRPDAKENVSNVLLVVKGLRDFFLSKRINEEKASSRIGGNVK